jgi:hypothetical protein
MAAPANANHEGGEPKVAHDVRLMKMPEPMMPLMTIITHRTARRARTAETPANSERPCGNVRGRISPGNFHVVSPPSQRRASGWLIPVERDAPPPSAIVDRGGRQCVDAHGWFCTGAEDVPAPWRWIVMAAACHAPAVRGIGAADHSALSDVC